MILNIALQAVRLNGAPSQVPTKPATKPQTPRTDPAPTIVPVRVPVPQRREQPNPGGPGEVPTGPCRIN